MKLLKEIDLVFAGRDQTLGGPGPCLSSKPSRRRSLCVVRVSSCILFLIFVIMISGGHLATQIQKVSQQKQLFPAQPQAAMIPTSSKVATRGALKKNVVWIKDLILKPAVLEVGGVMLFQLLGAPAISHMSNLLRRLPKVAIAFKGSVRARPFMNASRRAVNRASPIKALSSLIRRLKRTVGTLYRKRSRLSVAGEFTNIVAVDEEEAH